MIDTKIPVIPNIQMTHVSCSVQAQPGGRMPHKGVQTDQDPSSSNCNCEMRYNKIFSDFKQRLASDHSEEKDKALKELAAQVCLDKCLLCNPLPEYDKLFTITGNSHHSWFVMPV